jgi:hypothetical protein
VKGSVHGNRRGGEDYGAVWGSREPAKEREGVAVEKGECAGAAADWEGVAVVEEVGMGAVGTTRLTRSNVIVVSRKVFSSKRKLAKATNSAFNQHARLQLNSSIITPIEQQ